MLSKEMELELKDYLRTTRGRALIKAMRDKATAIKIDPANPNPQTALYQMAQIELVKFVERIAGENNE